MKSKVDLLRLANYWELKVITLCKSWYTKFLEDNGIPATDVNWPDEDGENNIQNDS